ncbi:hypothetical protein C7M84_017840 [Penaeus vannamei]|uniref:Uncharacterized protein n=1 Tax=Penaeus vannamei TaxID=6689 RepID=A0A3R7M0V2_PENVA|nr:hypothetical protein C7M84_017840 [Penaeus vannamei]
MRRVPADRGGVRDPPVAGGGVRGPPAGGGGVRCPAAGGGVRGPPAAGGGVSGPSAARGGVRGPPAGGRVRCPPAAGGGVRGPSAAGGGVRGPPAAGGGVRGPSAAGGCVRCPPAAGGGVRGPSAAGGGVRDPPAAGGSVMIFLCHWMWRRGSSCAVSKTIACCYRRARLLPHVAAYSAVTTPAVLSPWIESQDVALWYLLALLLTWGVPAARRRWGGSRRRPKATPSPVGRRLIEEVSYDLQAELKLGQGATQRPVNHESIHHRHVEQVVKHILVPLVSSSGCGVRRGQLIGKVYPLLSHVVVNDGLGLRPDYHGGWGRSTMSGPWMVESICTGFRSIQDIANIPVAEVRKSTSPRALTLRSFGMNLRFSRIVRLP